MEGEVFSDMVKGQVGDAANAHRMVATAIDKEKSKK